MVYESYLVSFPAATNAVAVPPLGASPRMREASAERSPSPNEHVPKMGTCQGGAEGATTFGLRTRKVALLRRTQDRKPNVFRDPYIARGMVFDRLWHPRGTEQKERHLAQSLSA